MMTMTTRNAAGAEPADTTATLPAAPRAARVARATTETRLDVSVDLDGTGKFKGGVGVPFFEHMLTLLARHSGMDLEVTGEGDIAIDAHHTVEDVGIAFGEAVKRALGDKAGLARYGEAYVPMEETLARAVIDLCNRPYFRLGGEVPKSKVGTFDAELGEEFFRAFAMNCGATLHMDLLTPGGNVHHQLEALFKALGRALGKAAARDPRVTGPLSTKGTLA